MNNESGDTTVPLDTIGRSKLGAINTVNSTPVGKFDITVSGCDFTKLTPAPANKSVAIGFTQSDSIDNSTGTLKLDNFGKANAANGVQIALVNPTAAAGTYMDLTKQPADADYLKPDFTKGEKAQFKYQVKYLTTSATVVAGEVESHAVYSLLYK